MQQPKVVLLLPGLGVGTVGGDEQARRQDEQPQRRRVLRRGLGGQQPDRGDPQGERQREGEHLRQLDDAQRGVGQPHHAVDADAGGHRGDGDGGQRGHPVPVAGERGAPAEDGEHRHRQAARQRVLRQVERQLQAALAPVQDQRQPDTGDGGGDQLRRGDQVQPGDEHQVGQGERVRVALQLHVHDQDLAGGEGQHPGDPRQAQRRGRSRQMGDDEDGERRGHGGDQPDQRDDPARHLRAPCLLRRGVLSPTGSASGGEAVHRRGRVRQPCHPSGAASAHGRRRAVRPDDQPGASGPGAPASGRPPRPCA